jgi:tRNA-specific 2-thiouridylase
MRSSQKLRAALLTAEAGGSGKVELHDGEEGIATGQACVFYASSEPGARVLGGGWIAKTVKAANQGDFRARRQTMAEAQR